MGQSYDSKDPILGWIAHLPVVAVVAFGICISTPLEFPLLDC